MALVVPPVCLVPTLKEESGAACLGAILVDVIGVAVVMQATRACRSPSSSSRRWPAYLTTCRSPTEQGSLSPAQRPEPHAPRCGRDCGPRLVPLPDADQHGVLGRGLPDHWQLAVYHLPGQADRTHDAGLRAHRSTKMSVADAENEHKGSVEEEMAEYRGGLNTVKYVVLRVAFVVVLVVLAIVFTSRTSWARRTRSRSPGPA
ncbi:hypothetical protein PR001_g30767 [Phytophthora rubi]|uniref:Uncharacterized protein n=1 Tax=Phytophthora rubi TaxID=129364 RepID=A0A6A3GPI9_9STRA|nr:hypothetical protein PR001_g30767 [Phytophthora rubi]